MLRYWLSLIVSLAGFYLTMLLSGSQPFQYVSIPSLIIVGLFPLVFVTVLFGYKNMVLAFSIPKKKETSKEELILGLHFFKTYGITIWVTGFISVLIAFLSIMENLGDKMALGSMLALMTLSLLYCGILYMVIIIPFTVFINKKRLNE
jgi:hypothetical protein